MTTGTSDKCCICWGEFSTSRFSKLDWNDEIDMISLATHVAIPSGGTENVYHTLCLAKAMKGEGRPVDPCNRTPLPPHITKQMHRIMSLLGIQYPSASELRVLPEVGRVIGHLGGVMSAVFSPDGNRIATASSDGTVRIWDAASFVELNVIDGHTDKVHSVAYSPDGSRVVTASRDTTVRVWDGVTFSEIGRLLGHTSDVWSANYSPNCAHVLSSSGDATIRVWDADTFSEIFRIDGHAGFAMSASYSPCGLFIYAAGIAGITRAYSWDGTKIITTDTDSVLQIENASESSELSEVVGTRAFFNISDLAYPYSRPLDRAHLITINRGRAAYIRDAETLADIGIINHRYEVTSAAYSPDGTRIITTCGERIAQIWNATITVDSVVDT